MAKRKHGEAVAPEPTPDELLRESEENALSFDFEEARARVKKLEAAIAEQTSSCEEEYKEGTSCDECSDRVICKVRKEG